MKLTIKILLFISLISTLLVISPINSDIDCSTYAKKVYCLTNDERIKDGKEKLTYSKELEDISRKKSQDMCENSYFSHDYGDKKWHRFIDNSNIDYIRAGENLAKGYQTAPDAAQALVNSPTHYENIIGDYTHIGVYTLSCGGKNLTTQTFAKL